MASVTDQRSNDKHRHAGSSERYNATLQENILTALCYDDEHGRIIADTVSTELFEGDYRIIAERAVDYWKEYDRPPGDHTPDLVSEFTEETNKRHGTYRRILLAMRELAKSVNVKYVMDQLDNFTALQRRKTAIIKSAEALNARQETALSEVDKILSDMLSETGDTWNEPDFSLLDDRRGKLPKFPIELIEPKDLREWVRRAAHGSGTSIDHVAVPLLGIVSSVIGTSRRVQASKSFTQPFTLWTGTVGFSGTGKTPGLECTMKPLEQIEADRESEIARLRIEHETRVELARAKKQRWKTEVEAAIKSSRTPPPMPDDAEEPGQFVAPRLYTTDATIEKMALLLTARPNGMLLVVDELARLLLNMSRYSQGQDNEFWLQAYDGHAYRQDRIGRPDINLKHLLIGIVGGIQPDKFAAAFKGPADGMYARFLFSWPGEAPYRQLTDDVAGLAPEIMRVLERVHDLEDRKHRGVPLSPKARDEFERLRKEVMSKYDGFDGRERDWWLKIPGHVLRVAGTLGYLKWASCGGAEPVEIGRPFVEDSVDLVLDYFWPHARAALRQIGLSEDHGVARRVLKWLRAKRLDAVSLQDIRRDALSQGLNAKETEAVMDRLEKAGWLRKSVAGDNKRGRPPVRWNVNPRLFEQ
jgi:hypothetical protein